MPSSTSGGQMTPAVSTNRRAFALSPPARASVHDAEYYASHPEECEQQAAEKHGGGGPWPVASAARTTRRSLKNGPNGGQAVIANMPVTKSTAERGVSIDMPRTWSIEAEPAARRILPALRKSAPLVRALLQT